MLVPTALNGPETRSRKKELEDKFLGQWRGKLEKQNWVVPVAEGRRAGFKTWEERDVDKAGTMMSEMRAEDYR